MTTKKSPTSVVSAPSVVNAITGMALNLSLMAYLLPSVMNTLTIEAHKNCSLHCKYKRMIIKGELK